MSDRCWFEIKFLRKDIHGFRDFIVNEFDEKYYQKFLLDYTNDYDEISIDIDEMNYGGDFEINDLANKKLTFLVNTGKGDEYDEAEKCCFFGEMSTWFGERYAIDTDIDWKTESIKINKSSLDYLKNFVRVKNLVEKYFNKCEEPEFLRQLAIKILSNK